MAVGHSFALLIISCIGVGNGGRGGGRGGQDSPNILPSRLYNIHTCSENRSVYYVRPSQNETASYAYACKRSKKVEKQELVD